MEKAKKAIVLGADNAYMDKVETTIKSLCVHYDNRKFYIFNDDLPIDSSILKDYRLPFEGFSYATLFRYFIPKYVSEVRVLYLDLDIIVRKPIDELWYLDLTAISWVVVRDDFYTHIFNAVFC